MIKAAKIKARAEINAAKVMASAKTKVQVKAIARMTTVSTSSATRKDT